MIEIERHLRFFIVSIKLHLIYLIDHIKIAYSVTLISFRIIVKSIKTFEPPEINLKTLIRSDLNVGVHVSFTCSARDRSDMLHTVFPVDAKSTLSMRI